MPLRMDEKELRQTLKAIAARGLADRKSWYSPAAAAYNAARPQYPSELIDEVAQVAQLSSRSRILEIGCGPGTATTAFAQLGCRMVCIEPNPEFCASTITNCRPYPLVEVINTSFEEWELEPEAFDAVLAASSMHWIPAEIGYAKASRALRRDGHLILLWNKELQPSESMQNAMSAAYQRHAPALGRYQDAATQDRILAGLGGMMLDSGWFGRLSTATVETTVVYTADQYIALLGTYSAYLQLDLSTRSALFAEIRHCILERGAGEIRLSYRSAYHAARKIAAPGA
jgi:SAM-dependent methyltransferase